MMLYEVRILAFWCLLCLVKRGGAAPQSEIWCSPSL